MPSSFLGCIPLLTDVKGVLASAVMHARQAAPTTAYDELMRLSALAPDETAVATQHVATYAAKQVTCLRQTDVLSRGLALTQPFLQHKPDGRAALIARRAVSDAIKDASPLYAQALAGIEHFDVCEAVLSGLSGVIEGLRVHGDQATAEYEIEALERFGHNTKRLWPRSMLDERTALHWATQCGAAGVQSLTAAAEHFPRGWHASASHRITQGLQARRALPDPTCAEPIPELTDEELDHATCLDEVYVRLGQPGLGQLSGVLLDTSRIDYAAERACLYRGFIAANSGMQAQKLWAFLRSEAGRTYLWGLDRTKALCARDGKVLLDAALA